MESIRRTGRSTRTVDEAIQKLFNYGEIVVPLHMGEGGFRGLELFNIISDPDWVDKRIGVSRRYVNEELINIIENRLLQEHRLKIKKKIEGGCVKLTLSDEYVISADI